MILNALNQFYDRLQDESDPDTGLAKIPPYGFSEERIDFIIILGKSGDIVDLIPNTITIDSKIRSKPLLVPASFKRPGKYTLKAFDSGKDNAFFLWDKTAYALGIDIGSDKKTIELTTLYFETFKRFNTKLLENSETESHQVFLRFLKTWNPEEYQKISFAADIAGKNIAFQFEGVQQYLHDQSPSKEIWQKYLGQSNDSLKGHCLITGNTASIARIHASIKGVVGGQSSGGSIVSFNSDSYESYGKTQGENAPVSELAAFKYTTALNFLLKRDNLKCMTIGDASTVFWAIAKDVDQSTKSETLFRQTLNPGDDSEAAQLAPIVEQLAQGRPLNEIAPDIDPDTRFYILGLAPNASRISIRFWLNSNFGDLAECLSQHYRDMALDPLPWNKPPSIWRLLIQLVPYREGQKPKQEDIPTHLAGEFMRAILTGRSYPKSLLAQILSRLRNDGHINGLRISLIKAVLQRNIRQRNIKEEIPMSLDTTIENEAYLLGRLFAVLERIQSFAIKGANATVADRYFATASTVPFSVFPRLLSGSKHHLSKIRKDKPGLAVNLDKDLMSIIGMLPDIFPKHFPIEDQGRFSIGYYHQREQDFATKTETSNLSDSE
ncbi:MAG TPA: type I-C CRISPR-associated protein Cas8c/Csd1 [Flavobacteriales bacterium]|nr:type I-C CRISPR-associated protein Cas8c/Csd1 [Flavobacteriales bacterium]